MSSAAVKTPEQPNKKPPQFAYDTREGTDGEKNFRVACGAAFARGVLRCALLIFLLLLPLQARAEGLCPADTAQSIAQVKKLLANPQETFMTDRDRVSLLCLADAVAKINDKLNGLGNGSLPFKGPINAPDGVVMIKPTAAEAH